MLPNPPFVDYTEKSNNISIWCVEAGLPSTMPFIRIFSRVAIIHCGYICNKE